MTVASEESFAPLAPIFRFNRTREVIDMATATEFGREGSKYDFLSMKYVCFGGMG
ncbi:MAG: aldehyde dehydrogenase family protein [Rhizobium sp.]